MTAVALEKPRRKQRKTAAPPCQCSHSCAARLLDRAAEAGKARGRDLHVGQTDYEPTPAEARVMEALVDAIEALEAAEAESLRLGCQCGFCQDVAGVLYFLRMTESAMSSIRGMPVEVARKRYRNDPEMVALFERLEQR